MTVTTAGGTSATSSADKFTYVTPLALTATGTSLPTGTYGASYTSQAITTYVTASGGSGTGYTYSVTGLPAGLSFNSNAISGTPTAAGTSTLTVKVTDSANNTATCALSLIVSKATLTVTANNASKTYGAANPTFATGYSGFVNGDTQSVLSGNPSLTTTATNSSPVGSYAITATAGNLSSANYTFTFVPGTLTVNKATLTVTANNASMTYGDRRLLRPLPPAS